MVVSGVQIRRSVVAIHHDSFQASPRLFEADLEGSADLLVLQPSLTVDDGRVSLRFSTPTGRPLTISATLDLANRAAVIRTLTLRSPESRAHASGGIRVAPDGGLELRGFALRGEPLATRDLAPFLPRLRGSSAVRDVDVFLDGSLDDLRRRLYPEGIP
jgi:hypothetical protein